ncbi:MAG: phosphonate metabolism protein/1,5-bisphosphokinase (PRPP-forming) PhnN [Roseateles asaccharophilus]|uniref:Ribose 1,5-bisphosphate phosphokinase PhnN n=1 Tax=Roseateles asaccharophilus TaxID=582607 RepID=A0A4R6ND72_9BURK|nr:phosphonate metabolism protein/1,5-bisphosphokinase (PRPP-forming) PhnN [Roseateles asaccharophilus]MDN3543336.1 phosphonate metabolism protein/1,5-bisphosphokinase (PRPP-forming) PhnN [Roseateles asaccharophilus]TDP12965.1 ribose 1,5-bisphosphokinase [Roseateles asaccharophilus]
MSARLIYVMGPSGSGKDSLLRRARETLEARPQGLDRICFAHRYITRPADAGAENHIALSPAEFLARRRAGLFALHWHSHGLDYGIGLEVEQWLARGLTVVMNGSREHLPAAQQRFSLLTAVAISVDMQTQRQRLQARARESAAAIEARLARTLSLRLPPEVLLIRNEGTLSEGAAQLLRVIEAAETAASA